MPETFINDKYIKCFIQKEYPNKEYDIRYFNDKYIFIVFTNENKKEETLVLKFDDFFDFSKCN